MIKIYQYSVNDGVENEIKFVNYLNNKKVNELNPLFYSMIEDLYGKIDNNYTIKAWKNYSLDKTDIYIKMKNIVKQVSIKKGMKNSVHVEGISSFISFLIENKVSKESVVEYLKFHYADGTTNGKGITRISSKAYKELNQDKIDMINSEINKKEIVLKIIDRCILKGRDSASSVDLLIHGEPNDFFWLTKEEIRKIILDKINNYSTTVHFGPLTCQPFDRCLNYNPVYEKNRFCVQIKWYNLFDDMIEHLNEKYIKREID